MRHRGMSFSDDWGPDLLTENRQKLSLHLIPRTTRIVTSIGIRRGRQHSVLGEPGPHGVTSTIGSTTPPRVLPVWRVFHPLKKKLPSSEITKSDLKIRSSHHGSVCCRVYQRSWSSLPEGTKDLLWLRESIFGPLLHKVPKGRETGKVDLECDYNNQNSVLQSTYVTETRYSYRKSCFRLFTKGRYCLSVRRP